MNTTVTSRGTRQALSLMKYAPTTSHPAATAKGPNFGETKTITIVR